MLIDDMGSLTSSWYVIRFSDTVNIVEKASPKLLSERPKVEYQNLQGARFVKSQFPESRQLFDRGMLPQGRDIVLQRVECPCCQRCDGLLLARPIG
jgi:hypothetical protein